MALVDRLINRYHCFTADPCTLDTRNLSELPYPESFLLEDHDIAKDDFDAMPDFAPEDVENDYSGLRNPYSNVACPRSKDADGEHMFWLFRMKTSVVTRLASLSEEQIEPFARRWSTHRLYAPFQFPPEMSYEVVEQRLREDNFQRIRKFLPFFIHVCRQSLASGKGVYVLWERHEYQTEELASAHKRKAIVQATGDAEPHHGFSSDH